MRNGICAGALACAALAALPAAAPAVLVGEFDARVKDFKRASGAYTVVADARVYDTTGAPPPVLTGASVHFPRGAGLRAAFLRKRFWCDTARLVRYPPDPARCGASRFASGRIVLDARPYIPDPFSADIHLFLGPGGPAEVASVVALVIPNQFTPAYMYQVLEGRLVDESRSGGPYGYRLELPTRIEPLIPGLYLHLAELHLEIRGLRMERAGRGPLFWTRLPTCPRSRKVAFGADYSFEGAAAVSRRRKVDCRRFARRPSVHREGAIPGADR